MELGANLTFYDMMYVSKPPKFDGKKGSAYVIWVSKFRSWAGVKGISGALPPSFDSKLPSKESNILDVTDPTQNGPKELPERKTQ